MTSQTMPAIAAENNTPVAYKGMPVMTTERLADSFGTTEVRIRQNHANNQDRFVDGVHFHKVVGSELDNLRVALSDLQISTKTRSLILWTERGAMNHAKILETPEAWSVYGQLVDTYFAVKDGKLIEAPKAAARVAPVMRDWLACAKLIGLKGNQAIVAANRATAKSTGVNVLGELGETKLLEAEPLTHHTVSDIAERMSIKSAQALNKLLETRGFQTLHQGEHPRWQPTAKGLVHAVLVTADPEHGKGKARQMWEWRLSIIDALIAASAES